MSLCCCRTMLTAQKPMTSRAVARTSARASVRRVPVQSRRRVVATQAISDTNFFVNLITSGACGAMAAAVTLVTAEDTDKEVRQYLDTKSAGVLLSSIWPAKWPASRQGSQTHTRG